MIKVGLTAFTAFNISTTDVSLSDYKSMLDTINVETKKEVNSETDFYLSDSQKEYLQKLNIETVNRVTKYKEHNENVFKNNFDRWVVEESEYIKLLVDDIINMSIELSEGFEKEAKYYKKYPSLSKKLKEVSDIYSDIYKFTKQYKSQADEAHNTFTFMSSFIEENREVLEALA